MTYCAVCGEELSREHTGIEALGHDLQYVYAGSGTHEITCSRCDYTATEACTYENGVCIHCGARQNPFVDVREKDYYYDAVLWAFYQEPQITNGTNATHFSPLDHCAREQIVTFLWRAEGCPEPKITSCTFTDVKKSAYYFKAVLWAVENEITAGIDDTHFGVNQPCTRSQAVTFLWRAKGSPEPVGTENPFADVRAKDYFYKAVLWAVENEITKGTDSTHFSPNATCIRGQIATFLYRAYQDR